MRGGSKNNTKIVSEYGQEIPQSQTADNPIASRGRAAQPSRVQLYLAPSVTTVIKATMTMT